MAAGLGFKTFAVGEVLSAANVNGYLMQGVLVFANATARDAAITSPQEGQFAFTKDNDSLWYYSGSAWVSSGATGDIEGVTAGTGISGGGTSGTVTVTNSMATAIDAKGDLIGGTGADTFARLAVGANDTVLTADSTAATGLKWAAPSSGASFSGVSIDNSTNNMTIANNTNTKITFDREVYDVGGYATAGSTITIPSGKAGYYLIAAQTEFSDNSTGYRAFRIYKNGAEQTGYNWYAGTAPFMILNYVNYYAVGDTIEFYVQQNSGGSLTIYRNIDGYCYFTATYLGA
jgi:hypothetical protein